MGPVQRMPLARFMAEVVDGERQGWMEEFEWLRLNDAAKMRALIASILKVGIQSPVLIGSDGRCWDGHHRVFAAWALGFKEIPVEYARGPRDA